MSDQSLARLLLCGTCCIWPLVVWFGLNVLMLPAWRRWLLGLLPGQGARAEREI